MAWNRILVTGAGGFIGSHLVEALVRAGYPVRAFVEYDSTGTWGWLDQAAPDVLAELDVVAGDVRDPYLVRNAVEGCDAILHLAALIAIPYSYTAARSYIDTNVGGTLNLLEAARATGVRKFVHTSTSEVYGTAQFVPITEEHPLRAQSPYAASKVGADQLALSYKASFDLPVSVIRPFNTYGPRQSTRAVIPTIITQLARGTDALRLGATAPTRDLNFVQDTCEGFRAVLEHEESVGQVINIGSNAEISIGDLAHLIAEVMGTDVEIVTDPDRLRPAESEVERLWADCSKAGRLLPSWRPAFAGREGLRRGLAQTVEWFLNPVNLARYPRTEYTV